MKMHPEADAGFGRMLESSGVDRHAILDVLDLGGQNVNGTVHHWFSHRDTVVTTLDLENADIIADATAWRSNRTYDVVICTEVFEHVKQWRDVIATAHDALVAGGFFIATCASTDRQPHGATGAPDPAPGEWYENVSPADLNDALEGALFTSWDVCCQYPPGDAYLWAIK